MRLNGSRASAGGPVGGLHSALPAWAFGGAQWGAESGGGLRWPTFGPRVTFSTPGAPLELLASPLVAQPCQFILDGQGVGGEWSAAAASARRKLPAPAKPVGACSCGECPTCRGLVRS